METIITVRIGKYTYESDPRDLQIQGYFIRQTQFHAPLIIKLVEELPEVHDESKGYLEVNAIIYKKLQSFPTIKLSPITYSNNPFIITPENE